MDLPTKSSRESWHRLIESGTLPAAMAQVAKICRRLWEEDELPPPWSAGEVEWKMGQMNAEFWKQHPELYLITEIPDRPKVPGYLAGAHKLFKKMCDAGILYQLAKNQNSRKGTKEQKKRKVQQYVFAAMVPDPTQLDLAKNYDTSSALVNWAQARLLDIHTAMATVEWSEIRRRIKHVQEVLRDRKITPQEPE